MGQVRHFVIREIGPTDSKGFAVVSHGEAFQGNWKRKCLWVHDWFRTEDEARAEAHRLEYPD